MHRKRSRSSSGTSGSAACASTRRLNSSWPSSRLSSSCAAGATSAPSRFCARFRRLLTAATSSATRESRSSSRDIREFSLFWRHVPACLIRTFPKKVADHLLLQVLACLGVGSTQPVFVDEHFLVFQPGLPGGFRYVLVNALAELPGVRGKIETFRLTLEL